MRACTEGEVGREPGASPALSPGLLFPPVVGEPCIPGLGELGFIPAGAAEVQGAAAAGNELVKMKKGHK